MEKSHRIHRLAAERQPGRRLSRLTRRHEANATPYRVMFGLLVIVAAGLSMALTSPAGSQGIISTVAGTENRSFSGDGGSAVLACLNRPSNVITALDGSFFIADMQNYRIRKVDPQGIITTVAGTGDFGFSGDGIGATNALIDVPRGMALAADGSLFFADSGNDRVRKIDPDGIITTVAGGSISALRDEAPATSVQVGRPLDVALLPDGSLLIAEGSFDRVRRVDADGVITKFAGEGDSDDGLGDGGPAADAQFGNIEALAVGPDGSVYLADSSDHRIRKIDPDGTITTVAGNGERGFSGDGGPAVSASLQRPKSVAVAADGTLFITDSENHRIRVVTPDGIITTFAGTGERGFSGDDGSALSAQFSFPNGVALAPDGSVLIADDLNDRIRRIDPRGIISTVAGSGESCFGGDGGPGTGAILAFPRGVAVAPDGVLFIADQNNHRIRRLDPSGLITTVAGSGPVGFTAGGSGGDGGAAVNARLSTPTSVVVALDGGLLIGDSGNGSIRRVDPQGIITTLVDNVDGFVADIGQGPDGSLYIVDSFLSVVRRVDPQGFVSIFAGNGIHQFAGDGGAALSASIQHPVGGAVGPDGSVYIADTFNHRIRKVDLSGIMTTVAGNGVEGFSGDGGPAVNASLNQPNGLGVGLDGSLYIADTLNSRIRKVDPAGIITTVAGNGESTFSGDGGLATEASLRQPRTVAVAPDGSIYIADRNNHRIRRVVFFQESQSQLTVEPAEVTSDSPFTLVLSAELPEGLESVISDTVLIDGIDARVALLPFLMFNEAGTSGSVSLPDVVFSTNENGIYTWVVETQQGSAFSQLCIAIGRFRRCP